MTLPQSADGRGRSAAIAVGPVEPAEDRVWPPKSFLLCAGIVISYAGVAALRPSLPENLAMVDPVLLLVCVTAIWSMTYRGSRATAAAVRMAPWVWLILVGSFLGLATVGIPIWAWSNMFRTVFALAAFVSMWHLLTITRLERMAVYGTAIGLTVTTGALMVEQFKYRGSAFFQHPNYAGHFIVLASVTLLVMSKYKVSKALALVALGIGLWKTASFGAIAMLLGMLGVVGWRSLKRNTAILAVALIVLAVGGLLVSAPGSDGLPSIDGWSGPSEVLSQERFEKSQGSRAELWGEALSVFPDHPFGVGPDGIKQRQIGRRTVGSTEKVQEAHSDAIGYLVERGIIGLVGFVGLWFTIWRSTRPGGFAHVLIVGSLVQGLFRETMHYRHLWILLALACVWDDRWFERQDAAAAELEPADA